MESMAIIYHSAHHGNTKKLLEEAAKRCELDLIEVGTADRVDWSKYQLVGFASGIYYGRFHQSVTDFALAHTGDLPGGRTFLLYTSGGGGEKSADGLAGQLREKQVKVLGAFGCKGYDTYGPFRLIGGIAKGHPDADDVTAAVQFLQGIADK